MRRIESYISDSTNKPRIDVYKSNNDLKPILTLRGKNSIKYIRKFYNKKAKEVIERKSLDNILIKYNDCTLEINNISRIPRTQYLKERFSPVFSQIGRYNAINKIRNSKKTKLQKIKKTFIITTSGVLSTIMLVTGIVEQKYSLKESDTGTNGLIYGTTQDNKRHNEDEERYIIETEKSKDSLSNFETSGISQEIVEETSYTMENDEQIEEIVPDNFQTAYITYENRYDSDRANTTRSDYYDIIDKYAKMYGLDTNLVVAIATGESITHSTDDTGPAIGLMQVEKWWIGNDVTAYNFEMGSYETVSVDLEKLKDLGQNIKIACMIFQNSLQYFNYSPLLGLQTYNMGPSVDQIVDAYCLDCGKNRNDVINDYSDVGWLDYTYVTEIGTPNYVPEILSYLGDDIKIVNIKPDGTEVGININSIENQKMY